MRRFLLDSNVVSALMRNPRSQIAARVARVGEAQICTSIVVAAELRYGAAKKGSRRLSAELEAMLGTLPVIAIKPPTDAIYGEIRAHLEKAGHMIGANDLFIAAHALALEYTLVTDNEREFSRVPGLAWENWLR